MLVHRAVTLADREAALAGVEVETSFAGAPVQGDPALLDRLIGNLVENGIRYNRRDGWVRVSTASDDGMAELRVANSGPTVSGDAIPELFEPFRRLEGDRIGDGSRGIGLGLSIVRSVANVHGGSVDAEPGTDGGLTVTVRLPLAAA